MYQITEKIIKEYVSSVLSKMVGISIKYFRLTDSLRLRIKIMSIPDIELYGFISITGNIHLSPTRNGVTRYHVVYNLMISDPEFENKLKEIINKAISYFNCSHYRLPQ